MKKALKAMVCVPLIVSLIFPLALLHFCIFLGQCVAASCEYAMDRAIDFLEK